jgi:hypothetical protein
MLREVLEEEQRPFEQQSFLALTRLSDVAVSVGEVVLTGQLGGRTLDTESARFRNICTGHGAWRSLVAHSAGGRAVAGSNPVAPISPC